MQAIPADPFPFPYERKSLGLIVIDMQRDFVEPGGFGASLGNDVETQTSVVIPQITRFSIPRMRKTISRSVA